MLDRNLVAGAWIGSVLLPASKANMREKFYTSLKTVYVPS
jgi:hypothetical protein